MRPRANLDLLWQSLDKLPNGEQDLLGPALNAALESLTAQPDPAASIDCGVQLMTIHKSKGLEFEVVIVPELQAGSRNGSIKLLSWLERGLTPEDIADQQGDSEEITEFLVAPLQTKGADRGTTKQWVDHVYRERDSQEMRAAFFTWPRHARATSCTSLQGPHARRTRTAIGHLLNQKPACSRQRGRPWKQRSSSDSMHGKQQPQRLKWNPPSLNP